MGEKQWLAEKFEGNRAHLRGVAYRMLGSLSEADDALQETWLRLNQRDTSGVQNLGGWLTTVVAHVCLDMLRSRTSRREESMESQAAEPVAQRAAAMDPEQETLLAESVGLALLVVLDTLAPAERLAFVLHDMFDVSFGEIAGIVGRSPEAARQLASRARRRVRGAEMAVDADRESHRRIVETFVTALRGGDFNALIALLDPDLVARADTGPSGAPREVRGAEQWAKGAIAYVQAVGFGQPTLMLVDGAVGLVLAPRGKLSRALNFTIKDGKISQIEVITEQSRLKQLNLAILTD
jgi:RNA polymerase sigma-70 factor (ECF subfamily)